VLVYLDVVDVKDEDAAVGTTVKRDTERLEALLSGSIPNLHGDVALVHIDFLCKEVGTDGCLVLDAELAVDVLVHEGRLADTSHKSASEGKQVCYGVLVGLPTVTQDDDLEQDLLARSHCT